MINQFDLIEDEFAIQDMTPKISADTIYSALARRRRG
jgi:hypothetical protein